MLQVTMANKFCIISRTWNKENKGLRVEQVMHFSDMLLRVMMMLTLWLYL